MSDSLRLHESHHTRPRCPSQTPGVYSTSCPLSWWCHPAISSSSPSPPAPNPFQHQGLFQWVISSHEVAKVLEFQLQHQSFQWTPRTDSFRMDWLDLLESPLDHKEIQPVHPKGISPGCSLKGLMLKLKLQYFGHLMQSWRIWKDPDAGKDWRQSEGDGRGWDGWMASLTQWRWVWADSGSWWWTGRPAVLWSMGSQRVGHNWATELNWC